METEQLTARFLKNVEADPNGGCWLWSGSLCSNGYGRFGVKFNRRLAHRLSYEMHVGEVPAGMHVCHRCDVRQCVNPAHLFPGTPKDNTADMIAKGRKNPARGATNGNARLSDGQIDAIRALCSVGNSQTEVAAMFGVGASHVSRIMSGHARKRAA